MPTTSADSNNQYTGYSPTKSNFHPYYFKTDLLAYGVDNEIATLEFAPSSHGGILSVNFPTFVKDGSEATGFSQLRRIFMGLNGGKDHSEIGVSPIDGTIMISGYTTANSGGVGSSAANFAHYFVATLYNGEEGRTPTVLVANSSFADSRSAHVDFHPEDTNNKRITVRFATSFISHEQALRNLQLEVHTDKTFQDLVVEAQNEWRAVLSRAAVTELGSSYSAAEAKDLYTVFYSSLYRASVFPRQLSEVAEDGSLVHWSPYATKEADRVVAGELTTDSGFWDAWNTVYPLLNLVNRPMLGTMMQGWVNAYKEGGWLPKWASPGYRGSMVGTMGDVSLADAIVNEIPGFDVQKAYEAIRKDAFDVPPSGVEGVGRVCIESYLQYGYIPRGAGMTTGGTCSEIVSRSLNYLQSDYAIGQAARKLGFRSDAAVLATRAANFSSIFNAETGFFRSRSINTQKWTTPFDQYDWGGDYTESGPWQYRFYLPYDPAGLAALYTASGRDMCAELDAAQNAPTSTFHVTGYGSEIHEQTEMPDHCWGQYAHNNQPVHHMLYMYMYAGHKNACAARGQFFIRKVLSTLYTSGSDMFAGDEDNGEMGAWYVLSSLGLYSLSPGSNSYVLGSPVFGRVDLDISDNAAFGTAGRNQPPSADKRILSVVAENNSRENVYVQSVSWNGVVIAGAINSIAYSSLMQGGTLTFVMGHKPVVV
jgi:predicted alpha-1,2-mannosidase